MHKADILRQLADQIEEDYSYHREKRSSGHIDEKLKGYVPNYNDSVNRLPLDGTYHSAWRKDIQHFMEHDWVDQKKYVSEKWDCENFAFQFKAAADAHGFNNIGIVVDYSSAHAYNIAVYPNENPPDLIEPQNDKMLNPGDGDNYKLQEGYILL